VSQNPSSKNPNPDALKAHPDTNKAACIQPQVQVPQRPNNAVSSHNHIVHPHQKHEQVYRPWPLLGAVLELIGAALSGFHIRTLWSSPAVAKTEGSLGCHATLLTQPICASRASIRRPLERQMYILESRWKYQYEHISERIEGEHTVATADYKVFVRTAEIRADNVLALLVSFEILYSLARVDLHEANFIRTHTE
jgi:hypothetical protein